MCVVAVQSVRAIGRCAVSLERAAERCIQVRSSLACRQCISRAWGHLNWVCGAISPCLASHCVADDSEFGEQGELHRTLCMQP